MEAFRTDDDNVSYRERCGLIIYTIREEKKVIFDLKLSKTPFDVITMPIKIQINELRLG